MCEFDRKYFILKLRKSNEFFFKYSIVLKIKNENSERSENIEHIILIFEIAFSEVFGAVFFIFVNFISVFSF